MNACTLDRWLGAQRAERAWWQEVEREALCRTLTPWYAEVLGIAPATVGGLRVLDLGGGPYPMAVLLDLPVAELTVVDPLAVPRSALEQRSHLVVRRVHVGAEIYNGPQVDEVWGYNVLQHVMDPGAVVDTAKRHGQRVRWFDWVETPIIQHHPHSLRATWLREQFGPGWDVKVEVIGSKLVPHEQHYCAVVAERAQ